MLLVDSLDLVTAILCIKAILSGTQIFSMSKPTKKVAGDLHIASKNNDRFLEFNVAKKFLQINTNNFITMTMLKNEVGARYQPHHDATFVDFGSDRCSDA